MNNKEHQIRDNEVFVFGSNLAGRHGKGAAKDALQKYGAIYGQGMGRQGRSYAIPTKDKNLNTLPIGHIGAHIRNFIAYAAYHNTERFFLTRIGCGLAGYTDDEIAPLFEDAPDNVRRPPGW